MSGFSITLASRVNELEQSYLDMDVHVAVMKFIDSFKGASDYQATSRIQHLRY